MKKLLLSMTLIVSLMSTSYGQYLWSCLYGRDYWDYGRDILPLSNGTILLAGETRYSESIEPGLFILKADRNGDTIWSKIFSGCYFSSESSLLSLSDGTVLIPVSYWFNSTVQRDLMLLNFDTDGDTLWSRQYGLPGSSEQKSNVIQLDNGHIISIMENGSGDSSILVYNIDKNGDVAWTRRFGYYSYNQYPQILLLKNSEILLSWQTGSGTDNRDICLLKLNENGDVLWKRVYGHKNRKESNQRLIQLENGDIIVGMTQARNNGLVYVNDILLIKMNIEGDTLWSKTYGSGDYSESFSDILLLKNGHILVSGYGNSSVWLFKIYENGNYIWNRYYSPNKGENLTCNKIVQQKNGDILLFGSLFYDTISTWDMCLIKIPDDQYAAMNLPFNHKLINTDDSLQYTYTILYPPKGMEVSRGGTVSWIPQSDSVFSVNPRVVVSNNNGFNDTVSFIIWVNVTDEKYPKINNERISITPDPYHVNRSKAGNSVRKPSKHIAYKNVLNGGTKISIPVNSWGVEIFDIRGKLVKRIHPSNRKQIVWNGNTGKYFIRIKVGDDVFFNPVLIVR